MQIEAQFKEYEEKRGRKDSCAIQGEELVLIFTGVSAHAMQPWEGENAILSLLDFLSRAMGPDSEKGRFVGTLHRLFGDSWVGRLWGSPVRCPLREAEHEFGNFEFGRGFL